jgi:hypothetical protein
MRKSWGQDQEKLFSVNSKSLVLDTANNRFFLNSMYNWRFYAQLTNSLIHCQKKLCKDVNNVVLNIFHTPYYKLLLNLYSLSLIRRSI